jgi:hypothetical protein
MKKQENKKQTASGRDAKRMHDTKHPRTYHPERNIHKPTIYNAYEEIEILQEFFTHPNYLEDFEM